MNDHHTCLLCNIIKFTNSLQTFLQAARLNWCDITRVLNTLRDNLQAKIENPAQPPTSYFAQVQEFIDIARKIKIWINQSSSLSQTNKKISVGEREIELLQSILRKTKIAKKKERIASLEKDWDNFIKKQNYNFEIKLKDWCTDNKLISMYQNITKIITVASLIPPSTAEVERSFSLMNLIWTPLCKCLSGENLGYYMRIWKFPRNLTENYQQILSRLLEGAGTKSKSHEINHHL